MISEKMEAVGDFAVAIISAVRNWKHEKKLALNTELKELDLEVTLDQQKELEPFLDDIKGTMKIQKIKFGQASHPIEGYKARFTAKLN